MGDRAATIVWFRRDLRLADHPALTAALARGGPVVPLFILDSEADYGGAAPRWRLAKSLESLDRNLREIGGRLILRRGAASEILPAIVEETGADAVYFARSYERAQDARDVDLDKALDAWGVEAKRLRGRLLTDPDRIETQAGDPYKVYTPFSKAVFAGPEPSAPDKAPTRWSAPTSWPKSDALADWELERDMNRGGEIVALHGFVGEAAARERLDAFLEDGLADYADRRDRLDLDGTSGLSAALALGEIGPRTIWHAAVAAMERAPEAETGGAVFLKELVWREFAWHLLHHWPDLATRNWREDWDRFPWRADNEDAERWRRGRTGVPVVDAAMRELYVTGRMHNRARMATASYLTKHLLTDWRVGEAWFRDCLVDWDEASNAMGWQWVAGSGPDAAPFFRIFNPETQAEKFDPEGAYVARWLPEARSGDLLGKRHPDGLSFFEACPRSRAMSPEDPYPEPVVSLAFGRQRALEAYERLSADTSKNKKRKQAS